MVRIKARESVSEDIHTLSARLRERHAEVEAAVLNRINAISDIEDHDSEYLEGLRDALAAAIDYGLTAAELSDEHVVPIPSALLTQARAAARSGVPLDTVLRRYIAGYTTLSSFILQEADKALPGLPLQRLFRRQAALFESLVAAVTEEYEREASARVTSLSQRRAKLVRRLLDGELIDADQLAYDLDGWHIGVVARGPSATAAIRLLAALLDRRLLVADGGEGTVWAWFGGQRKVDSLEIMSLASSNTPESVALAIGEPGQDLPGWRLTHRQARAALPVANRGMHPHIRYADVALLAAALRDETLANSLRNVFLAPLARERNSAALRRTLRT